MDSKNKAKSKNILGDFALESNALKNAVFNQWFVEKQTKRNKMLKIKSKKQEALQLKEQKEREEKEKRVQASFRAWLEMKKKQKQKKEIALPTDIDQSKDEKRKIMQKSEAKVAFKAWKLQKDKILEEKKEKEEQKKKTELEKLEEKKKEGKIAFHLWKKQKDSEKWKTAKHLADINLKINEQNKIIQERRSSLALRAFSTWLAEKVFLDFYIENEYIDDVQDDRPPWYPSG